MVARIDAAVDKCGTPRLGGGDKTASSGVTAALPLYRGRHYSVGEGATADKQKRKVRWTPDVYEVAYIPRRWRPERVKRVVSLPPMRRWLRLVRWAAWVNFDVGAGNSGTPRPCGGGPMPAALVRASPSSYGTNHNFNGGGATANVVKRDGRWKSDTYKTRY